LPTVQPPSRHPTAPPDTADEGGARDTLTPEEALRLVENRLEAERKLKTGLWVLAIMTILIQFFLIYISTYWFIKGARKLIPSMRGMSEAEKKLRNKRRWAMILGLLILAIPLVLTAFLVQWAFLGPVINDAFVGLVLILLILLFPLAPALGLLLSFIYTNDLIELLKKRRNQLREKVK
jgi:peptidoglycan/LPS O-acetylase OafA/YrhL